MGFCVKELLSIELYNVKESKIRVETGDLEGGHRILFEAVIKLGRDLSFFDLLEGQSQIAVKAAETFSSLVDDFSHVKSHNQTISNLESEGDDLTHRLQTKLSGAFITPLDHEDLSELSHILDDITDCIEALGARIEMYKLIECRSDLRPVADNLLDVTKVVDLAVSELKGQFARSATLPELIVKIHTLENESDRLYRAAITHLFDEVTDPILVIKWKEVYDRVEHATDRCETVANLVDNMIVKYA